MFGRGLLLSTFIVAVVFASTVYSWKQECHNGFCKEWNDQGNLVKCTRNGAEIPCDSSSAAGGHQKSAVRAKRQLMDHDDIVKAAGGNGAECVGYGLGLMVAAFFANVFRQ